MVPMLFRVILPVDTSDLGRVSGNVVVHTRSSSRRSKTPPSCDCHDLETGNAHNSVDDWLKWKAQYCISWNLPSALLILRGGRFASLSKLESCFDRRSR